MARIKMSGVGVTNILGKIGGTIFSRNRGGAYIKNFVVPTNPQTERQQIVRTWFGTISTGWRNLTEDERASWDAASENYPVINPLGETIYLSGKALYQRLNTVLLNASASMIDVPLIPTGALAPIELDSFLGTVQAGVINALTGEVLFSEDVTGRLIVDATRRMHRGRKAQESDYRRVGNFAVAAAASAPFNILAGYIDQFGNPAVVGDVINVRCALVVATGEISTMFSFSHVLTAHV